MTVTANMGLLAEQYRHVWDADAPRDLVDQVFARDVVDHNPQPQQGPGREGIRQVLQVWHGAFPDLRVSTEDVVVSGDRVVLRWSGTGTHEGDQLGAPATHRQVRMTGIDILRVDEGRIVERWGESNELQVMQQLG
jgi:steroid delta-isomerase-like uncharacterized protein